MNRRAVLDAARAQGFTVERRKGATHLRFRCPRCGRVAETMSHTTGDVRALRNSVANLRKHGFKFDNREANSECPA